LPKKKIAPKSFYKKFDQKSKTDFFSVFFYSRFWAFLGEGRPKTPLKKYQKNKSDLCPCPFLASEPPTHHGPRGSPFFLAAPSPFPFPFPRLPLPLPLPLPQPCP
jgi:hypothetical protein